MCFYSAVSTEAAKIEHRFKAKFKHLNEFKPANLLNGFAHPKTPVITHRNNQEIELFEWGLLPAWAKDRSLQKNSLNARIETLHEKPMFRQVLQNRCLVIATGFYEWQWLDEKGKNKQRYFLRLPDQEIYAFAGLWNEWVDQNTGEIVGTYTIITTEAQGIMREIHNSKMRMPFTLLPKQEQTWLQGNEVFVETLNWIAEENGEW